MTDPSLFGLRATLCAPPPSYGARGDASGRGGAGAEIHLRGCTSRDPTAVMQEPSQEPSREEPSQGQTRAEQDRTKPSRAEPGQAGLGCAELSPSKSRSSSPKWQTIFPSVDMLGNAAFNLWHHP